MLFPQPSSVAIPSSSSYEAFFKTLRADETETRAAGLPSYESMWSSGSYLTGKLLPSGTFQDKHQSSFHPHNMPLRDAFKPRDSSCSFSSSLNSSTAVDFSMDSISGSLSTLDFPSANDSFSHSLYAMITTLPKQRHSFSSPGVTGTQNNKSPLNHKAKGHKPEQGLTAQDKLEQTFDL